MDFPVMPKVIRVQEGLAAGRPHQPHPQMVSVHIQQPMRLMAPHCTPQPGSCAPF